MIYQHEATFFSPQADVALHPLLCQMAREMDKKSAAGWEILGPPIPIMQGPQIVGGAPKVTWVVWARRPKVDGEQAAQAEEAPAQHSMAEASGANGEAVSA